VHVALHNPFRDKVIAGVVLEIAFKQGPDEKPTVLNLFIRLSCNPLQSEYGAENLFNAHEAREAKAIITLKEVHYYPEETAKTE
jgi:hypothetical protein